MKSLVGKIGTLALVALAGVAVAACSSTLDTSSPSGTSAKSGEHVGTVSLQLQPVFGITVTSVHYIVTAGDPTATPAPAIVAEGNLPTPGTSSTFAFGVALPVGTGYFVSLSGVSAETNDNITCSGVFGPFAVQPNQSAPVAMTLTCVDNTNGQLLTTVDVKTDACPRLVVDYAVAEPGVAKIGDSIDVHSTAHDLDNPTEAITYAWSIVDPTKAAVGSFTAVNAHDTTFKCNAQGDSVAIKITATNHQCSKGLQTVISCKSVLCGNGAIDPGETCDFGAGPGHPADPTCPADCTKVCGDGNPEGNEVCDPLPLNPDNCFPPGDPLQCTPRPASCGDGFVTTPAEVCDGTKGPNGTTLPAGSTCSADCKTIQGPVCGDGATGGSEQCDAGTGTNATPVEAPSRTCADDCKTISTDACVTCEQAGNCFASSDNCLGPATARWTQAQRLACYKVTECIRDSNCLDGATGSLGTCYCGTLDTGSCGSAPFDLTKPGAPNGPCAQVMQDGASAAVVTAPTLPITTNPGMLSGLNIKSRPTGAAGQRLNCDKTDTNCAPLCGVQ